MSREPNVPLLLWISTAVLAHIATGGGADQLARIIEDRADLHQFAQSIRVRLRGGPGEAVEVAFVEDGPKDDEERPPDAPKPPKTPEVQKPEVREPEVEKKPEAKKAEAKAPPKVVPPLVKQDAPPPPPPQADRRIAVRQHADP